MQPKIYKMEWGKNPKNRTEQECNYFFVVTFKVFLKLFHLTTLPSDSSQESQNHPLLKSLPGLIYVKMHSQIIFSTYYIWKQIACFSFTFLLSKILCTSIILISFYYTPCTVFPNVILVMPWLIMEQNSSHALRSKSTFY